MNSIVLFGFGSQGQAWAKCLKHSGWDVRVVARSEASMARVRAEGLALLSLTELTKFKPQNVALLVPDDEIAKVYHDVLRSLDRPLRLVIAHGFSVASGQWTELAPQHERVLFAPKAIGPQIWASYQARNPHDLKAAVCVEDASASWLESLGLGLGFKKENLIETSFEKETIGDLISEQGLLCGGVLSLLLWTAEEMERAGVPPRLIREECIQELNLIAGLMNQIGPEALFSKISKAAQVGATEMKEFLEVAGFKTRFQNQLARVGMGDFFKTYFDGQWKSGLARFQSELKTLDQKIQPKDSL